MGDHEMFKTTLMGGFDKEDVLEQVQNLKDDAASKQSALKKEIAEKDAKIAELLKRIDLKDAHQARMESEIEEKYQKYIDNYDSIGRLVFEAQLKADAMVKEAEEKCRVMIQEAEEEARHRVEAVQYEIEEKLRDGKKKYIAVQDEMNEIVQLINEAQKRFMESYREVHQIVNTMPTSLSDIEDETEMNLDDNRELDFEESLEEMEDQKPEEKLEKPEEDFDQPDGDDDEYDEDAKLALQISRLLSEEDEMMMEDEMK